MFRLLLPFSLLAAIFGLLVFNILSQPVNPQNQTKAEFVVKPGQTVDSIADSLSQQKLIRSRAVFKIIVLRYNLSQKIQAGYFYLSPSMDTTTIAQGLTKAAIKDLRVTIPEGLRRQEIANLVLEKLVSSKVPNRFDPDEFIQLTTNKEGTLFPSTYSLPENPTAQDLLTRMEETYSKTMQELGVPASDQKNVTILASLLEREASSDEERPTVAGILTNRLKGSWPLQIDATVQFALANARCRIRICDWWPTGLTLADLKIESPYNTYQKQGLPPGPISNPGRASLAAAANPLATKYWFYLHDPKGQIHYATTVSEHNANVCTYLKKC